MGGLIQIDLLILIQIQIGATGPVINHRCRLGRSVRLSVRGGFDPDCRIGDPDDEETHFETDETPAKSSRSVVLSCVCFVFFS